MCRLVSAGHISEKADARHARALAVRLKTFFSEAKIPSTSLLTDLLKKVSLAKVSKPGTAVADDA